MIMQLLFEPVLDVLHLFQVINHHMGCQCDFCGADGVVLMGQICR